MAIITAGFIGAVINAIILVARYIIATIKVQEIVVSTNPLYMVPIIALLPVWWAFSTQYDAYNFYDRKNATLNLVALEVLAMIAQVIWQLSFDTLVFRICKIPIGRNLDEGMLLNLCRITLLVPCAGFIMGGYGAFRKIVSAPEMEEKIENFRIQYALDLRENKENLYDLRIIKEMQTGKDAVVKMMDRFVHMFILGNSGTGKTSSTLTPGTICDLDKKMENRLKREKFLKKMLASGQAEVVPDRSGETGEWSIRAVGERNREILKHIKETFPDAGMTLISPNNALNVDMIRLCKARNLPINIIDPADNDAYREENVRLCRINPFYLPRYLTQEERQIQIINQAQNFSAVLLAINELQGTGDTYFKDLNTAVTTYIAIVCMVWAYHDHRQTSISEVQRCINDMEALKETIDNIQKALHIEIIVKEPTDSKSKEVRADKPALKKDADGNLVRSGYIFRGVSTLAEVPSEFQNEGMTVVEYNEYLRQEADYYYIPVFSILQEILGGGSAQTAAKMFDQIRGLRNIINNLLMDPRVKNVLSGEEGDIINFDKVLERNEITVVNTALEFSAQNSMALGLFIMLSFKTSVLRRPMETRSPHFLTIDELAQYMHPVLEDMIALFRQYKVACIFAMQSLSQTGKNDTTAYLRDILLGCGTHIVFGRVSTEEMKIYEAMAGIENKETVQTNVNSNSEFDANYNVVVGERHTQEQANVLDGYKIRNRNFQEVTVYQFDQGRVKNGFIGKVSFPKKADYADRKVHYTDFASLAGQTGTERVSATQVRESETDLEGHRLNVGNTTRRRMETHRAEYPQRAAQEENRTMPKVAQTEEGRKRMGKADKTIAAMQDDSIFDKVSASQGADDLLDAYQTDGSIQEEIFPDVGTGTGQAAAKEQPPVQEDNLAEVASGKVIPEDQSEGEDSKEDEEWLRMEMERLNNVKSEEVNVREKTYKKR